MTKKLLCLLSALALLLCGCARILPLRGTVEVTSENLARCLLVMTDFMGDGNETDPLFVECGYSCSYHPGLEGKRADVSFDIVFACGVTAHVDFDGTDIRPTAFPVPSPVPFEEGDSSYTFENVTGSITY